MSNSTVLLKIAAGLLLIVSVHAADSVPNEIQMPGTQPGEITNFEAPDKCANCHAGYNDGNTIGEPQHEPVTGWRGGAPSLRSADHTYTHENLLDSSCTKLGCRNSAGVILDTSLVPN